MELKMHPVLIALSPSSQLENRLGGEERFQERVTRHLIPCIAQFSVAMADDSLWKPLNYQILLKTRDSSPKVRVAHFLNGQAVQSHGCHGCRPPGYLAGRNIASGIYTRGPVHCVMQKLNSNKFILLTGHS
jgi:hypothetical protein